MRTPEEIVARVKERQPFDPFCFEIGELLAVLPVEQARPWLKEGVTVDQWKPQPRDRESVLARMLDYMPFAWDKANHCRGLSVYRSMSQFTSWVWLAGDDFGNLLNYEYYGKPHLVAICEHYGWDHGQWDNGVRVNSETEE